VISDIYCAPGAAKPHKLKLAQRCVKVGYNWLKHGGFMNGQTVIAVLLGLIVLKLYPTLFSLSGPIYIALLLIFLIAFITLGGIWLLGFIGNLIDTKEKRKNERKELKEISKTLKQIEEVNKRVK
jgi:hypothetical protein